MRNLKLTFYALSFSLIVCLFILACSKKDDPTPTPPNSNNSSPVANFTISPTFGDTNTIFTFDASSCSDNETSIASLQVRWDFDNDGIYDKDWSTIKSVSGTFPIAATYTAKLEVKDADGLISSTVKSLTVDPASFTDSRDGNVYNILSIANQTWMIENIAYKISDKQITDAGTWAGNSANDGWCYYDNSDDLKTLKDGSYGILYQWEAAKLAVPNGWHLPSEVEIKTLIENLGGESVAGGKLKEVGTDHWNSPNTGATDEIGYKALPGGFRDYDGAFEGIGEFGTWWTSTEYSENNAWGWYLRYDAAIAAGNSYSKKRGFSVRCVKDNDDNTPPFASFTIDPENGDVNTDFTFDASISSDGETSLANLYVRWDFNNDGNYDTEWSKTKTTSHTFSSADTYTVKLQVEDEGGLTNTSTQILTVGEANTTPTASFTIDKNSGDLGTLFAFDASNSSDTETESESLLVRWDFNDDGTFEVDWTTTKTTTHTFSSTGTQTIKLEVKDEGGLIDSDTKSVDIAAFFTDNRNENTYNIVAIGDQLWFSENLNYDTGTWWWWLDNYDSYGYKYARLYNWETAKTACPQGWHLPTDEEWKQLEIYLGMSQGEADLDRTRGTDEGKKLKSTSGWSENYGGLVGSNSSGFNALAGGYYNDVTDEWMSHERYAAFWTSTETTADGSNETIYAWTRMLYYSSDGISRNMKLKSYGLSVRCVKD